MTVPHLSSDAFRAAQPAPLLADSSGPVWGWAGAMTTVAKKYTPGEIDRAGKALIFPEASKEQLDQATEVMDNWRVYHSFPLEIARAALESRAKLVNPNPLIGTRLKREESIRAKLKREPSMKLSTMQDVGGCRVILRDMAEVEKLIALYANDPDIKFTDYVKTPRVSGYRGKHIIMRFKAESEQHACYNNMRIELQVRTELQHSWATAVEVCSTFTEQNLKSDHPNFKDERWVRFFALMGCVMAMNEGGGLVKDTPPSKPRLLAELHSVADALRVNEVMDRWSRATQITQSAGDPKAHQFLIELQAFDHLRSRVNVTPYGKDRERQAAEDRVRLEIASRAKMGIQVALVAVQSLETLGAAYPNYFSDTKRFLKELDIALHGRLDKPFITSNLQ
jgi:hypothetical protein